MEARVGGPPNPGGGGGAPWSCAVGLTLDRAICFAKGSQLFPPLHIICSDLVLPGLVLKPVVLPLPLLLIKLILYLEISSFTSIVKG